MISIRPRRNRQNPNIRNLVRETTLSAKDFIAPLFLLEGENCETEVTSMPGQYRRSLDKALEYIQILVDLGVPAIAIFPVVPEGKKTPQGEEAWNENGLIPNAIRKIKAKFPDLLIAGDIALDPFNSDGHDGLVSSTGEILNDETLVSLAKQAICIAKAGVDFVAPSDMMDGRVGHLRQSLDDEGYTNVGILAYSAKYASAFYGPFRDALDSAPKAGDKKTYQMDPANSQEALREVALDLEEGADIVMVKPAGAYLDIIEKVKSHFQVPVAAYQVSGEYAMIVAASQNGWLDRKSAVLESLLAIKRAGADMILTYFAQEAIEYLRDSNE